MILQRHLFKMEPKGPGPGHRRKNEPVWGAAIYEITSSMSRDAHTWGCCKDYSIPIKMKLHSVLSGMNEKDGL